MTAEETISVRLRHYDVGPVDTALLLRSVHQRGRRRHRLQLTAGATAALVAAGSIALAYPARHETIVRVTTEPSTAATPSPTRTPLTPTYLPPGAVLASDRVDPDGLGRVIEWSLPGAANENTVGTLPLPSGGSLSRHPATFIQLSYRDTAPPDEAGLLATLPPADPKFGFHRELRHLRGQDVYLTTDADGVLQRLDWLEQGRLYNLWCERLFTDQGRSGVPLSELLRMFEGLR